MQRYVGRIRALTTIAGLVALIIVGRLYYLQVMRGQDYERKADAQFVSTGDPLLNRGTIYFSDKDGNEVAAASLRPLTASSSPNDHQRYYPGGSLAAQEIGFVAYNNDNTQKGRYGLEKYYDDVLSRDEETGNFWVQLFGGLQNSVAGGEGSGDLITTIEPSVQAELERTLSEYDATWHPDISGGIIMDPKTGEIVAMAVSPTFDLNQFNQESNPLIYQNPIVQNVYEMGSIFKPLTMAAGIDSGVITENTTYDDTGCITVDTKRICNYDFRARGVIPMQQVLSQSLNVGASFIATKMGPTIMRDYFLNHYDIGQETGVDLPGEVHGLTQNLNSNRQVEFDTASFGQGVAVTPIETIRALSTLANGGYLVTPHLGKAITYDTGVTRPLSWPAPQQVLKPDTAVTVSRMLTTVVDTALANGKDKLDHYSVAAKTGTAQIANPAGGGYYTDRYLHSFFSYFPSYDARFVILLYAVYPKGAPYASETWAPPWHDLVQFLINYYNLPPDR
jgi:stage V sporulation protein D (sporulation-specific penicillin-binding protein)